MKIGRNDPCPCGSGKKYKRCCLGADEAKQTASAMSGGNRPGAEEPFDAGGEVTRGPEEPAGGGDPAEVARIKRTMKTLRTFAARQMEIECALEALEKHREEFDNLRKNANAYMERARALFADDRFASYRFTNEEVERAFDEIGPPSPSATTEETFQAIVKVISRLADEDQRAEIASALLMHLPDYVKARRFMDAWILAHCANLTVDDPDIANAFFFEMIADAWDARVEKESEEKDALLRDIGLDPEQMRRMSDEELEEALGAKYSDPMLETKFGAFIEKNPELAEEVDRMEREMADILQRPDARPLLLSREEVEPWIAPVFEGLLEHGPLEETNKETFAKVVEPIMVEMADAVFTPERIDGLIAPVREFREKFKASGDETTAALLLTAIVSLRNAPRPSESSFLYTICYRSFQSVLQEAAAEGERSR